MMISTRGRYALRVLLDLAEHLSDHYIPMKEIAGRQDLSLKYIERIMPVLSKNGLVDGVHGKGGGYRLTRKPCEYTAGEILRAMEGSLAPIPCLDGEENLCPNSGSCFTLPFWSGLGKVIDQYVDSITLEDLYQQTMNTPGAAL